ncbi:MAG: hypothetical protein GX269_03430 [Clostridiales bacterium]|nr:hypothetical protein [Clostridiales bacterium]
MQEGQIKYFLGTNSSDGFSSLFNELYDPFDDSTAYIIKGGPGTGKSVLLKKVAKKAQKKGIECEMIYCASDPKSLDAVILPEMKMCVADGTSPHIIEPKFAGCVEQIINLGDYWDAKKLKKNSDEIKKLYVENSGYYQRSQRYLSASSLLLCDSKKMVSQYTDYEKLINYSIRLARRELGCATADKKAKKRYLSAITPDGFLTFEETLNNLCENVIMIDDSIGNISERILSLLSEYAQGCGYSVVICPSPVFSTGIDQVIIPELSLAFIRAQTIENILPARRIHARRFIDSQGLKNHKNRIKFNKKAGNELQDEAISLLKGAKSTHDELEKYYIDAMNFEAVEERAGKLIKEMGL